jgi:UPF0716 protein FxsA
MQILLFLVFIGVPIAEVALFIQAGQLIGLVPTVLLTIGTAVAGSFLMRIQGVAALNRVTESIGKGEMPVGPVLDGMGIFVAGLLLLTPGLLTDTIGLLLFVPPIRRWLARWISARMLSSGRVHVFRSTQGRPSGPSGPSGPARPGPSRPAAGSGFKKSDNIVDAEFETIDPDDTEPPSRNGSGKGNSPWRRR